MARPAVASATGHRNGGAGRMGAPSVELPDKEFARQFSGSDQMLWGEPRTYGIEFLARY